jgi:hypothetical protein
VRKTVWVSEVKSDVKAMKDEELMAKYGLSKNDLKAFFDRFMRAWAAGREKIDLELGEQTDSE